MFVFMTIVHVLLCIFMIFVILLQPGKDAGMGAALGGGAATTAFGGRGAVTFLGKLTAACAIAFFLTSLGLSFIGLRGSVADELDGTVTIPVPAAALPSSAIPVVPAPAAGADKTGNAPTDKQEPNPGATP
jgi:preprotein translocase subunit SecG